MKSGILKLPDRLLVAETAPLLQEIEQQVRSSIREMRRKQYPYSSCANTCVGPRSGTDERHVRFGSRLCENSDVELARRKFVSITLNKKKNRSGSHRRKKKREKTILRIL